MSATDKIELNEGTIATIVGNYYKTILGSPTELDGYSFGVQLFQEWIASERLKAQGASVDDVILFLERQIEFLSISYPGPKDYIYGWRDARTKIINEMKIKPVPPVEGESRGQI